jgi:hypothetical protein
MNNKKIKIKKKTPAFILPRALTPYFRPMARRR